MNLLDRWRERRQRAWWDRWEKLHRWDRLANYNGEFARGIVHTAEYDAEMRQEQALFNAESAEMSR